jgi:hypothetical protein
MSAFFAYLLGIIGGACVAVIVYAALLESGTVACP